MKKLLSIIFLLLFLTISFNSFALWEVRIHCEQIPKMESHILNLYNHLIKDKKFKLTGKASTYRIENSIFINWPSFVYVEGSYTPRSINKLTQGRKYCFRKNDSSYESIFRNCKKNKEISYEEFIANKNKINKNYQNDYEERLRREDLENMKSALFYDYMDSVETYKWASPISLNEYNNCSNFNPKNIIKNLKIN